MYNTARQEECNADTYNYEHDFQILTIKERRGIVKNAQAFLKLQKENGLLSEISFFPESKNAL